MGGIVGGPHVYDGPGLGWAPWKCPACAGENTGSIDAGCVHCGSGSAQPRHVGHPPPAPTHITWNAEGQRTVNGVADLHLPPVADERRTGAFDAVRADLERGMSDHAEAAAWAANWHAQHSAADGFEGFVAGYLCALQVMRAHTMTAPPVTVDTEALAIGGKARRTIIAALEIFRDQILREATEEIASGEWCSVEETEGLIQQLQTEEEP